MSNQPIRYMKEEITIKEDWRGVAIKAMMEKIGYGVDKTTAEAFIKIITESTTKIELKLTPPQETK